MPQPAPSRSNIKRQAAPGAPVPSPRSSPFPYRPEPQHHVRCWERSLPEPGERSTGTETTTAITYDANCLEEICGSCAMLINGKRHAWPAARASGQAASDPDGDKTHHPGSALQVSRGTRPLRGPFSVLFENLKAVKAWVPIDGTYDLGCRASPAALRSRSSAIRFQTASPAPSAWRSARSSMT